VITVVGLLKSDELKIFEVSPPKKERRKCKMNERDREPFWYRAF